MVNAFQIASLVLIISCVRIYYHHHFHFTDKSREASVTCSRSLWWPKSIADPKYLFSPSSEAVTSSTLSEHRITQNKNYFPDSLKARFPCDQVLANEKQAACCMQYPGSLRGRALPTSLLHSATGKATLHLGHWTVGMRPPSRWWENVEKGSWHGGFVGQSLPYGPGLLTSKLHLCENIKCLSCLGHCFDRRERWLGAQAPALAAQSHRADRHVEENVSAWGDYLTPVSQSIKQDE